ncbi:hypothetical protein ACLB2K_024708 [Fragaria x ananassa]
MANQNGPPEHFNEINHICCIGARHASVMSMAVIAAAHPQVTVTIVDYDVDLVQRWEQLDIDFVEPGFQHLVHQVFHANLFFHDQVEDSINEAQMIFIGVEIPTKGCGSRLDLVGPRPMGKSDKKYNDSFSGTILTQAQQNAVQFAVFSNLDFYSPGHAIQDLTNQDQVLIARKSDVGNADVLREMYAAIAQPNRIIVLPNYVSVELAKVATNVIVAAKMNYANMVAAVCGKTGANFNHVRQIIGSDYRINGNYMDTQLGIGGDEIMKSTLHFRDTLQQNGLRKQAKVVSEMVKLSKRWSKEFVELVLDGMVSLRNKVIAVFGVTYKSNVADLKNSRAIEVCKSLLTEGATLRIFDPLVNENAIMGCFTRHVNRVQVVANQQDAYDQAHATLCLVDTNIQFDFQAMQDAMVIPPYLFIACNLNLDNVAVEDIRDRGFQLYIHGNQIN